MRYVSRQIVFREIPEEISLSYMISGCGMKCPGCHSADAWSPKAGEELTLARFCGDIEKYRSQITCVLFLGGEWSSGALIERLEIARLLSLKTALYTGEYVIDDRIRSRLNYLKVGPYVRALGGLESPNTNQRLYDLSNDRCLNYYFQKHHQTTALNTTGVNHDQTEREATAG